MRMSVYQAFDTIDGGFPESLFRKRCGGHILLLVTRIVASQNSISFVYTPVGWLFFWEDGIGMIIRITISKSKSMSRFRKYVY